MKRKTCNSVVARASRPQTLSRIRRLRTGRPRYTSLRPSLAVGMLAISCLLSSLGCSPKSAPPSQPEVRCVILITIDTLRADALSVYGSKTATPFFEKFARSAVVFDHAYTCAPITLPAHTSLLTGLYPPSHGVRNNGTFRAPANLMLLPEYAKQNGVTTAAVIGGFPLASQFGLNQGFDFYDDDFPAEQTPAGTYLYAEKNAEEVRVSAQNWFQKFAGDSRPFLLWLHFFDPHHPYRTHESSPVSPYLQEVRYVDSQLALFFRFLREKGIDQHTLIIITADHGEAFGEHGEISHSLFVYNTTLHIPLLISMPGVHAKRQAGLARIIDIAPTILEVMHWKATSRMDGLSLLPLLGDETTAPRENYAETFAPALDFGWSPLLSIQNLHAKYIQAPHAEFYNLDQDPDETANRIASVNIEPYRKKLAAITAQAQKTIPYMPSSEEREQLESLGYFATPPGKPVSHPPDPKDRVEIARKIAELSGIPASLPDKAQAYEAILKQDPNNPLLLLRYGEIVLKLGDTKKAEAVFQQVLDLEYPSAAAYNGLAAVYYSQKNLPKAGSILQQAANLGVADGETYYNLAELRFDRGERQEAFQYYDRSMRLGFLPAFYRIARLKEVLGDEEGALKILDRAQQKSPHSFEVHYERGMIYFRRNRFDAALAEFRKGLEKSPDQKWLFYNIGLCFIRMNKVDDARHYLAEFVRIAPPSMKQEKAFAMRFLGR